MYVFNAKNVAHALTRGIIEMRDYDNNPNLYRREGRGGKATYEMDAPVATVYHRPLERVVFCPVRNINPFFHLFEALWILAGRNDVKWITHFLNNFAQFSDDGVVFHGAYGKRLRCVDHDQVRWVINHLHEQPNSRRAVLNIFMHVYDHDESKDIPCNSMVMFNRRAHLLDMTVLNRSNDMVWGAYGTNAVQFSYLQELVASCLGCMVGTYTQFSNNFHVYAGEPTWERLRQMSLDDMMPNAVRAHTVDPYEKPEVIDGFRITSTRPYPLMLWRYPKPLSMEEKMEPLRLLVEFDDDLNNFMERSEWAMGCMQDPSKGPVVLENSDYRFGFFREVAVPLFNAFQQYRLGNFEVAMSYCQARPDTDWHCACALWLKRIERRRNETKVDKENV